MRHHHPQQHLPQEAPGKHDSRDAGGRLAQPSPHARRRARPRARGLCAALAAAAACAILVVFALRLHALARLHSAAPASPILRAAASAGHASACSRGAAPSRLQHHHPLLLASHSLRHASSSGGGGGQVPLQLALTQPEQPDVAASRLQLQAYLGSSQHAAALPRLLRGHVAWAGSNQSLGADPGRPPPARGILVVAGGRKLLMHLVVQLQVLRETLACTLPVEVAWQGPREMDNATLVALARRFGPLTGFDVQAMPYLPGIRRTALTRWVGKIAALLHCSFQEVILLDSDNLPLVDPAYLFKDRLYLQHGNLFWPDFWTDWVKPGVYPWLGLNASVVKPLLAAGAGNTGRDAESGMVVISRRRWLGALFWVMWVNAWHDRGLYYRLIHGDKDTFALGWALAGHADKYRQVSVPPGGVFRWGKGQLEIKCRGPAGSCNTTDGWQLLGPLQHDDTGRAVFFHRTMNKLNLDEQPWPAEVVTGPLPSRWLQYYLAHNSKGSTKGVWWEHVVPAAAFLLLPQPQQTATVPFAAHGSNGSAHRPASSRCPREDLQQLHARAAAAGLPVDAQPSLACDCWSSILRQASEWQPEPLEQASSSSSSGGNSSSSGSGSLGALAQPVAAARVTRELAAIATPLRVIEASLQALEWLRSMEGRAAFPSLHSGAMP